jgi:hypothetical protein
VNKDNLNTVHGKGDIEISFDRTLVLKKVEQAISESEQGLGQDWDEFKAEWLKEEY